MRPSEGVISRLESTGLPRRLVGRSPWRGVVVLAYHRIGCSARANGDPGVWSASWDEFDAELAFLTRHFDLVAPSEVPLAALERRGRFAAVTFDDGYREAHEALPLLRAHGVRAGFFVCTGFVDGIASAWWDEIARIVGATTRAEVPASELNPTTLPLDTGNARQHAVRILIGTYKHQPGARARALLEWLRETLEVETAERRDEWMSWEMIRDLRRHGMEVGGHTVSHPVLARLRPAEQIAEIADCAQRLEQELGERVRMFSYPVGLRDSFDTLTQAAVADAGGALAFSCYGGSSGRRAWDPLDVRRVPIGAGNHARFRRMVERASALVSTGA
jgi:peptidoglycan/xylan/chitin deacetylase (PgdA/CDA1 family)